MGGHGLVVNIIVNDTIQANDRGIESVLLHRLIFRPSIRISHHYLSFWLRLLF